MDFEQIEISSRKALRKWLEKHHAQTESVWLIIRKKEEKGHVPYSDVVEEALCWGWVDSRPRKLDSKRSMILLSPRRTASAWSKANKERVARLTKDGLMAPPGLAKVAEAKKNGAWSKLDAVENLIVPADLSEAFHRNPPAADHWASFPRSVKRGILEWIAQAKKPETRARRINETAQKASRNERANQWRTAQRKSS